MAAFEKVHSLRLLHAGLRRDDDNAIRGMFVQKSSQKDGSAMMVGGRKFSNEEKSRNRGRPISFTV